MSYYFKNLSYPHIHIHVILYPSFLESHLCACTIQSPSLFTPMARYMKFILLVNVVIKTSNTHLVFKNRKTNRITSSGNHWDTYSYCKFYWYIFPQVLIEKFIQIDHEHISFAIHKEVFLRNIYESTKLLTIQEG
jgi:hypothetical protein